MESASKPSLYKVAGWLAVTVSVVGLLLRIEHAWTFDHAHRGSDFNVHLQAVRWMMEHWEPFFFNPEINYQIRSYPPLWYALGALILKVTGSESALAILSLFGFVVRHAVLWRLLQRAIPQRPLARAIALAAHALLPLGILTDGKVNPEGLHSGFFALALYALWRMERQNQSELGISPVTAGWFGAAAGAALMTKHTGGLLLPIAGLFFVWVAVAALRRWRFIALWRRVVAPALAAGALWCAVSGYWCGTNVARFGHPFPHAWNFEGPASNQVLAEPMLYRRPVGWVLPFEWAQYWRFPMLRNPRNPRPNFWATEITGTWSDVYNRGFCRLAGPGTDYAWGARNGFLSANSDDWIVSYRCAHWFAAQLHFGVWVTLAAVLAMAWCGWQHLRTWGARGSLVLPLSATAGTFAAMWLALAYPLDNMAALNPRYLLPQVMPISACLGLAVAEVESLATRRTPYGALWLWLTRIVLTLILTVGGMVAYGRFGP